MPSYGQHGNALHHVLFLKTKDLPTCGRWAFECKFMDVKQCWHDLSSTKDGTKYGIAKEERR
jgi:hypothetical protein